MANPKKNKGKKDGNVIEQLTSFYYESNRFISKCAKPNRKGKLSIIYIEYMKILWACIIGFLVMGFIGYFVKLIFIPINNIILGTSSASTSV